MYVFLAEVVLCVLSFVVLLLVGGGGQWAWWPECEVRMS